MSGPVTMLLLRHGRTELNASGRLRGRVDAPLDDVGRRQAAALGELFATVSFAAIVSSPLSRASDTASAVAAAHPGVTVEVEPDLADRDWGEWAGWSEAEVVARFGALDAAPGVEPAEVLGTRAVRALERLAGRAKDRPVLAVAHDAVNRAALAGLAGVTGSPDQPTGCWNELVREAGDGGSWMARVVGAVPGDGRLPLAGAARG